MSPEVHFASYNFFGNLVDKLKGCTVHATADDINETTESNNIRVMLADDDSDER